MINHFPYLNRGGVEVGVKRQFLFRGILDQVPGAAFAGSTRVLSRAFLNEPIVRVRRSSDSTEQDFTEAGITGGALLAFTGAGDGFVTTLYDQSGNGRDVVQVTAANQPLLVEGGVLVTKGGKASLKFDGTNDFLTTVGTYTTSGWGFGVYDPTANTEILLANAANLALTIGSAMRVGVSGDQNDFALPNLNPQIGTFKFGTAPAFRVNGAPIAAGPDQTTTLSGTGKDQITIGCRNLDDPTLFWSSTISELLLYPSDQSANRAAIEANIAAHYGIILA